MEAYLSGNLQYLRSFLVEKLPMLKLVEPESTYLEWIDLRKLNMRHKDLEKLIVHKAKLWLDSGHIFGSESDGFERVNIAWLRETLVRVLNQLYEAIVS